MRNTSVLRSSQLCVGVGVQVAQEVDALAIPHPGAAAQRAVGLAAGDALARRDESRPPGPAFDGPGEVAIDTLGSSKKGALRHYPAYYAFRGLHDGGGDQLSPLERRSNKNKINTVLRTALKVYI